MKQTDFINSEQRLLEFSPAYQYSREEKLVLKCTGLISILLLLLAYIGN